MDFQTSQTQKVQSIYPCPTDRCGVVSKSFPFQPRAKALMKVVKLSSHTLVLEIEIKIVFEIDMLFKVTVIKIEL